MDEVSPHVGYQTLLITNVTEYGSPLSRGRQGFAGTTLNSSRQIRKLRMLAQVIRHEAAAGDDLQSIGAD